MTPRSRAAAAVTAVRMGCRERASGIIPSCNFVIAAIDKIFHYFQPLFTSKDKYIGGHIGGIGGIGGMWHVGTTPLQDADQYQYIVSVVLCPPRPHSFQFSFRYIQFSRYSVIAKSKSLSVGW